MRQIGKKTGARDEIATWKEIESLVLRESNFLTKKFSIEQSPEGYLCTSIKIIHKEPFHEAITEPGLAQTLVMKSLTEEEIERMKQFMILFQAFYHRDYTFAESLHAACKTYIPTETNNDSVNCMLAFKEILPGAPIPIVEKDDSPYYVGGRVEARLEEGMPKLNETDPVIEMLCKAFTHRMSTE